jgi:hypothetical protein
VEEYVFETTLVAVVRVRASDENSARKVLTSVLDSPSTADIQLANETNSAWGWNATVTSVAFSTDGSAELVEVDGNEAELPPKPRRHVRRAA